MRLFDGESESFAKSYFVSGRFVIIDQSIGICDQGNKQKNVILPNFNELIKCWSFEKVREKKSTLLTLFQPHSNSMDPA